MTFWYDWRSDGDNLNISKRTRWAWLRRDIVFALFIVCVCVCVDNVRMGGDLQCIWMEMAEVYTGLVGWETLNRNMMSEVFEFRRFCDNL